MSSKTYSDEGDRKSKGNNKICGDKQKDYTVLKKLIMQERSINK